MSHCMFFPVPEMLPKTLGICPVPQMVLLPLSQERNWYCHILQKSTILNNFNPLETEAKFMNICYKNLKILAAAALSILCKQNFVCVSIIS